MPLPRYCADAEPTVSTFDIRRVGKADAALHPLIIPAPRLLSVTIRD